MLLNRGSLLGQFGGSSNSGGGGPSVDATARASVASIAHPVGTNIANNDSTWQANRLWDNRTGSPLAVPSPATIANMQAAGFVPSSAAQAAVRVVSANTTLLEGEHVIVAENAADVTVTIAAGVTRGQVSRALDSIGTVFVVPPSGTTIAGDATGAEINETGSVWLNLLGADYEATTSSNAGGGGGSSVPAPTVWPGGQTPPAGPTQALG